MASVSSARVRHSSTTPAVSSASTTAFLLSATIRTSLALPGALRASHAALPCQARLHAAHTLHETVLHGWHASRQLWPSA